MVKIFTKGQIPLSDFLYKIKGGEDVKVRTLTPNFTVLTLKMWAAGSGLTAAKSPKFVIAGIVYTQ